MRLLLQDNLLFTSVMLTYRTKRLTLDRVVIDTGSAGTIFSADKVAALGIAASDEDRVGRVFGVGGYETFYIKAIDRLDVGDLAATNFEIEVGVNIASLARSLIRTPPNKLLRIHKLR